MCIPERNNIVLKAMLQALKFLMLAHVPMQPTSTCTEPTKKKGPANMANPLILVEPAMGFEPATY